MLIERVEAFPLYIDSTSGGYVDRASKGAHGGYVLNPPWRSLYSPGYETLLVKVTAQGVVGWGEGLAPVAPHVAGQVVERLLRPILVGQDARNVPVLWHRMSESMRERGHLTGHQADAMAAVDIALWDLRGRAEQRSVADLVGGRFRDNIPSYLSGIRGDTNDERIAYAETFAERGVNRVKLHLGRGVKDDLAIVDLVQNAMPGARIAVDAHWSYSLGEARALGRELDERDAWFFEAPLAPEDIAGHRDLSISIATPIAVGESLRNRFEFADWLGRRALQIAQPDIARTGITEGMRIATLAEASHARIAPHHSAALGVAMAAGLHVAAATPTLLAFEFQAQTMEVARRILQRPLVVAPDGTYAVTEAPGLGVEVDEDAVRYHVVQ